MQLDEDNPVVRYVDRETQREHSRFESPECEFEQCVVRGPCGWGMRDVQVFAQPGAPDARLQVAQGPRRLTSVAGR